MGRATKRRQFEGDEVARHLRVHHPACPDDAVAVIIQRVNGRVWRTPVKLGQAVGIAISTYVRHELTDYDDLLKIHGLTQEEARLVVGPEIRAIIESWGRRSAARPETPAMGLLSSGSNA